jgi:ArsR family transcriptional regulator, arsenate/arsenite/antimonite-responsive transcriptional repressor
MKTQDIVSALGALAHESRLAVFRLLVKRGPQGYTPGELAERLEIPAPTLSFHLKELQRVGLLRVEREGRFLNYTANFEQMNDVLGFLTENCCSLADRACDVACPRAPARQQRKRA